MWVLQEKNQLLTVILIFLQYSQNGCIVTMEKNTIAKKYTRQNKNTLLSILSVISNITLKLK